MADMIEKGKSISSETFLSELESQTTKVQNINHQIKTTMSYSQLVQHLLLFSVMKLKEHPSLAFTYLGMPSLHVPNSKDLLACQSDFKSPQQNIMIILFFSY